MSAILMDGAATAKKRRGEIKQKVAELKALGVTPTLAVIQPLESKL